MCVQHSNLASHTNINKLQITQNTALRIATVCTTDTNTQHLHDDTHTTHKGTTPTTRITTNNTPDIRNKQHTTTHTDYTTDIDRNTNTIDDAKIKTSMKHIHTTLVSTYLNNRQHSTAQPVVPWPYSKQTHVHYYFHL